MKELIGILKQEEGKLLAKIDNNEMPIKGSIEAGSGIRYEDGKKIYDNFYAYKKEAKRFKLNEKNIILSRKVFESFLYCPQKKDLFLFTRLTACNETRVLILQSFQDKMELAVKKIKLDYFFWIGYFCLLSLVLGLFFFLSQSHLASEKDFIFFTSKVDRVLSSALIALIPIGFVRWCWDSYRKKQTQEAKRFVEENMRFDFFSSGHDNFSPSEIEKEYGVTLHKIQVDFVNVPGHARIAVDALKFRGEVGYIILTKNIIECTTSGRDSHVRCSGVIPVILLKETIIFYPEYFQGFEMPMSENPEKIRATFWEKNYELFLQ